jgi:hypothetical protein
MIDQAPQFPRIIALVGQPKSGKSLVQQILADMIGAKPIDSGLPLRQIAMDQYGLTRDQVFTQEGKLEFVEVLGRKWQVRELLGELGNRFEEMHGDAATPWMITRSIADGDPGPYCDASCRKSQGAFYKKLGGVVIGLRRPDVPNSPYAFDQIREEYVDIWINNDGLSRGLSHAEAYKDLVEKVSAAIKTVTLGNQKV